MDYRSLNEHEFAEELESVLSPSAPIVDHEKLFGRDDQLRDIRRALYTKGTHIFIYGDRGVGKSSLARTAAHDFQSSDFDPILVVCGPDDTFSSVIHSILKNSPKRVLEQTSRTVRKGVNIKVARYQVDDTTGSKPIAAHLGIDDAISLLEGAFDEVAERLVVVIDEIDVVSRKAEREYFASFIKALGDKGVRTKFIFTGVASSLDEILGAHKSAIRQLSAIRLEKLIFQGLIDIVEKTFEHFGLEVDRDATYRLAAISDGYPHYVHLVCQQMLWHMYDNTWPEGEVSFDVFYPALNRAIQRVSAAIRKPYEDATMSKAEYFIYLVWAAADSYDLERKLGHIKLSYLSICKALDVVPISEDQISSKLSLLKKPAYGSILSGVGSRRGWYKFTESMVRGYVRLCAEAQGIQLKHEDCDSPDLLMKRDHFAKPRHRYHDLSRYVPPVQFGQGTTRRNRK